MSDCDVFISYKREERPRAEALAQKLKSIGLKVWFDTKLAAGASFDDEIAANLKAAKAVLVCWTPGAIGSDWVRAEAAMAHSAGKLVAVFLAPTELIPPFNLIHAEDLSDWSGEDDHAGWAKVLARIASMSQQPALTEWAALMAEGDGAAMRKWVAAQQPGPLRSTSRFWLSEMNAAPIFAPRQTGAQPRVQRKGGGLLIGALVAVAVVGAGGFAVYSQLRGGGDQAALPAETSPPAAGDTQAAARPASGAATQGASAAVAPRTPQAIEIADGTMLRVPINALIDFETGRISEDGGDDYDFELVHMQAPRFQSRGAARMQWNGFEAQPNRRTCAELRQDYMVDLSFARDGRSLPYQCFVTNDGHAGYIRGVQTSYEADEPIEFEIFFFR